MRIISYTLNTLYSLYVCIYLPYTPPQKQEKKKTRSLFIKQPDLPHLALNKKKNRNNAHIFMKMPKINNLDKHSRIVNNVP